jgi:hypothetical protein
MLKRELRSLNPVRNTLKTLAELRNYARSQTLACFYPKEIARKYGI